MTPLDGIGGGHDQTFEFPTGVEYAHLFYGEMKVVSRGALVSILYKYGKHTNQAVKVSFLYCSHKKIKN